MDTSGGEKFTLYNTGCIKTGVTPVVCINQYKAEILMKAGTGKRKRYNPASSWKKAVFANKFERTVLNIIKMAIKRMFELQLSLFSN